MRLVLRWSRHSQRAVTVLVAVALCMSAAAMAASGQVPSQALIGLLGAAVLVAIAGLVPLSGEQCDFCGARRAKVKKLIASPHAVICDGCVQLCVDVLREGERATVAPKSP